MSFMEGFVVDPVSGNQDSGIIAIFPSAVDLGPIVF
jgi:hypothetical protein